MARIFIIGDPHFKTNRIKEGQEFIDRCISECSERNPDMIVLLGDVLDTHESINVHPFNLVCQFLDFLSKIAPTYVLMGNHDLINKTQFLTDNHGFNPYKKWKNLTIVDSPILVVCRGLSFIMCPYVDVGKFVQALETKFTTKEWKSVECIFAHQEFYGAPLKGTKNSVHGDRFDKTWPMVISGHIHTQCILDKKIFYTGSAIQHDYSIGDTKKYLWLATFSRPKEWPDLKKVDLGIKGKKIVNLKTSEISTFDKSLLENYSIRVNLHGTLEELKILRKSRSWSVLKSLGVDIKAFPTKEKLVLKDPENPKSFDEVLTALLKDHQSLQATYDKIFAS